MNAGVTTALVSTLGLILVGLLGYLGVRYTQRQAAKASAATTQIERVKVDAAAYESARETWESAIATLERQLDRLETSHGRLQQRVTELEQSREQDHQRIAGLTHSLGVITDYALALLRRLRDHQITYPEPPAELGLNEGGRRG